MITEPAFRYSHTVGCYAIGGFGFTNPVDAALGRNDVLYVVSRGNLDFEGNRSTKRITVCNLSGDFLREFGTGGTGDGHLMWPASIAADEDEDLYISDEALDRISIFNKQGEFLGKWGARGSGRGEFHRPAGIAFDKDGNLLVADGLNSRIQRYTREGRFLGGWGKHGKGDGEFNMPWGITVDHVGNVYVADWRNDRIQKFDADGRHLTTFGSSGQGEGEFRRPAGIAVDLDGNIYVADWGNERFQVLEPDGRFIAKLRGESEYSKWAKAWFFSNQDLLEEREKANLEPPVEATPWGDFLRDESANVEKLLWGPTSVKVDDQGRVYVVDTLRHRVQVYRRDNLR